MEKPQKELATVCEFDWIEYCRTRLPGLRPKRRRDRALYFPQDGHWNALGNELAAEQAVRVTVEGVAIEIVQR